MRDVLYKAKRSDNGEWVEGSLIARPNSQRRFIVDNNNETALRGCTTGCSDKFDWQAVEVDPNTICQYTGLTDKNGNKIWENDVLHLKTIPKVRQQTEFLTTVDWDAYCAGFLIEDDKEGGAVGLDAIAESGIYEIIENLGSIFDNAELLEGQVQDGAIEY